MSDEADMAQLHIEREVELALKSRKFDTVMATGHCLNCDTSLPKDHRWCDHDCMTDWQKRRTLNLHRDG